jgi:hypothetical protein
MVSRVYYYLKILLQFISVLFISASLASCGMSRNKATVSSSGVTTHEVKCTDSANDCMNTANAKCPNGFNTVYSDSHAGGVLADILPGPITWYELHFICSNSPGTPPVFAWQGPQDMTPVIMEAVGNSMQQLNNTSPSYTPSYSGRGNCTSDSSCGIGEVCVKGPGKSMGKCLSSVNKYGIQKYNQTGGSTVSCRTNSDCSIGFRCDRSLKACVR